MIKYQLYSKTTEMFYNSLEGKLQTEVYDHKENIISRTQ